MLHASSGEERKCPEDVAQECRRFEATWDTCVSYYMAGGGLATRGFLSAKFLGSTLTWEASAGVVPLRQLSRAFSRSKGEGAARGRSNASQPALASQQVASLEIEAGARPASLAVSEITTQKGEGDAGEIGAPAHKREEEGGGEQEPPRKVARGGGKPRVVAGRGGRSQFSRKW